jgi:Zn-dependent protease/CBS domain-containing protein
MFGTRWRLFRLFGIPIRIDLSWLVILALITWTVAGAFAKPPEFLAQFYPEGGLGLSEGGYLIMGLVAALLFFLCILLHEMGHALVARSVGMPIRGITLFLFGGVAELGDEPPSAGSEFAMAIAGPLVSVVLAVACGVLASVGARAGWPPVAVVVLAYLAFINGAVLVLNLLPAFPLDGGRVLRSILWGATGSVRRATRWASFLGQAFAWLLIAWGVVQFFFGNVLGGIWSGLIGLFLNSAARGSYQQVLIRQALEGEPVRRFMNTEPIVVPPDLDLRGWVEDYVYRYHRKAFPVGSDGRLEGYVTTQVLSHFPRSEWAAHTVGEVMERDLGPLTIVPDADAMQALGQMQRTGVSRLLVVEGGRLVGIISLKDLLRFLHLKLELEQHEGAGRRPAPPLRDSGRRETPAHP